MSARAAPRRHGLGEANDAAAVEIDVSDRWDALALSELLIPFHSFLVQHGPDRWVVHARSPGSRGEGLDDAVAAIDQWRVEQEVEAAVRVDGRPHGRRR
jgi:hypothetical protein